MKIKLMIIEPDKSYLDRLSTVFSTRYNDKLTVVGSTNAEAAKSTIVSEGIEVVLADVSTGLKRADIPANVGFALLTDSAGINNIDGVTAISKFQKADMIYKSVLDLYAEGHANIQQNAGGGASQVILFTSPAGGTGSSSLAAAAAVRYAKAGKKTLYLNLEKYGIADSFFAGEGYFTLSDIIYAIKSRKANLGMKLESCVKMDESGVFFYSATPKAMDIQELTADETVELVKTAVALGKYDCICVDVDFSYGKDFLKVLKLANRIVITSDGTENSNIKVTRAYEALKISEGMAGGGITNLIGVMYNKFSNKISKELANPEINSIGGAPRYEHATVKEVVNELSKMVVLDTIL